jgi:mannose-6-phosphate isomerase-like protein (cupin superfamily)
MSERIEKPWGWSQEVYRDELTRVVRIHVEPGGFCSWHKHERQANSFHLLSGSLHVFWKTIHGPREIEPDTFNSGIGPHFIHRFDSPTGCEALEIYTSTDGTPPDENDIVRFSEGGVAKP